jgi:hypothetical protein
MRDELADVAHVLVETEGTRGDGDVARIDPVGDPHVVVGEQAPYRLAQQRRVVAGERREDEHARLLRGALAHEVQQAAKGLFRLVDLAHAQLALAHPNPVDAERRPVVALGEPRHQVERGGNVAAAGKVGERAVGVAVDLVAGAGEEPPRLECRALPVVQLIKHRLQGMAPSLCCNAEQFTRSHRAAFVDAAQGV